MGVYGSEPKSLGRWDLDWSEYMHYLYLPVVMRENGYPDLRLPTRLKFAGPLINAAYADHVLSGYPAESREFVYLTAHRGWASPGHSLNRPGWHADGFGTDDVNYVWASAYPTQFAIQTFEDIDPSHSASMEQFASQINPATIRTYADGELLRLDPFVVHHVPEIPPPGGERSFLKVSFSRSKFDLAGNAHNYLFDYDWPMHPRSVVRNDPARRESDTSAPAAAMSGGAS